jgi:hypothetical protein
MLNLRGGYDDKRDKVVVHFKPWLDIDLSIFSLNLCLSSK